MKPTTTYYTHQQKVEIYSQARQLLVRRGWVKGSFTDEYGYCLVGAVGAASGHPVRAYGITWLSFMDMDDLLVELNEAVGRHSTATHWNDRPWRRQKTVLKLLDRLIARHSTLAAAERRWEAEQATLAAEAEAQLGLAVDAVYNQTALIQQ